MSWPIVRNRNNRAKCYWEKGIVSTTHKAQYPQQNTKTPNKYKAISEKISMQTIIGSKVPPYAPHVNLLWNRDAATVL